MRERVGVRVSIAKALILITLILTFSLEGRRNKTLLQHPPCEGDDCREAPEGSALGVQEVE